MRAGPLNHVAMLLGARGNANSLMASCFNVICKVVRKIPTPPKKASAIRLDNTTGIRHFTE
jgi:hypothetical protein